MTNTLVTGVSQAKWMLERLAYVTGSNKLQMLSVQYVQRLPEATIIGCRKCGTTFLAKILSTHSEIAMAPKETLYFEKYSKSKNLKMYRAMMRHSFADQITMEITPSYWITADVPRQIAAMNPNTKVLLIVRDPACRIPSDYHMRLREGEFVNSTFDDIMTKPRYAKATNPLWEYSLYDIQMKNWLTTFPLQQILIIRNEDLRKPNAGNVLRELEEFLGVNHELQVVLSENKREMCINGGLSSTKEWYIIDEHGVCLYEAHLGHSLKDICKKLITNVANFEKMVHREFHWFK